MEPSPPHGDDADVVVVGLGPVGAVLAIMLGRRGHRVVVVERDLAPYPLPRAVAADDEVLRALSALPGMRDLPDQVNGVQRAAFVDGERRVLTEMAFGETPLGMPGLAFFHQPGLEASLRRSVAALPTVSLLAGSAVTGVRQSADRAFVELATGRVLQARYVVGCDGASSGVREAIGVPYTGATAHAPWLVVDVETDAPLRHLPYFSYICDPARPAVSMPLPGGHRWEWMVLPGEDAAALAAPDSVRALLRADVDPDQVRVVRSAVYAYHARMAASWRQGRVLLAGDAAHCMPPFAGQGFGAGVRDAAALSWRLDEVLRGRCGPELLSGYERERRPHVQSMTRLALLAGRVVQPTAPAPAAAARSLLRVLDRTPGVRGAFRTGRARPAPRLPSSGLPHGARVRRAGSVLPNPRVRTLAGRVRRLDDLLEDGWGLLAAGTDPRGGLPDRFLEWLRVRPVAVLSVVPPGGLRRTARLDCDAVEDLDGTLIRLLARAPAGAVLLARPDRYLVGADTPQQLMGALDALHLAAGPEIR